MPKEFEDHLSDAENLCNDDQPDNLCKKTRISVFQCVCEGCEKARKIRAQKHIDLLYSTL